VRGLLPVSARDGSRLTLCQDFSSADFTRGDTVNHPSSACRDKFTRDQQEAHSCRTTPDLTNQFLAVFEEFLGFSEFFHTKTCPVVSKRQSVCRNPCTRMVEGCLPGWVARIIAGVAESFLRSWEPALQLAQCNVWEMWTEQITILLNLA